MPRMALAGHGLNRFITCVDMALMCRQGLLVIPNRSFAVDNVIQTLRDGRPSLRDDSNACFARATFPRMRPAEAFQTNGLRLALCTPPRLFHGLSLLVIASEARQSSQDRRGAPRLAMTERLGNPPLKSEHWCRSLRRRQLRSNSGLIAPHRPK